ncbi:receptor-like protein 33 [Capsicum annuum]|uniref:receptor-like protein 33 n=1 Tax=Capsicum annuum TaxID=4072 RepID=UPI001FB0783E|nr:receptor-like protein 33 [Capsicum annuum]
MKKIKKIAAEKSKKAIGESPKKVKKDDTARPRLPKSQLTCFSFAGQHLCACDEGTINANSSLTKLGHLQRLNLAFNYLDYFPLGNNIGEHSSLTHLNLSHLGFNVGEMIPPGLLKVVYKLISLDISNNYYTLQVSKTNFRSLVQNLTNYLQFHGEIPSFLPTRLQYLGLYGNQFGGQVPRSLANCTRLKALDLGTFPIWLEKLPNLQVMILKSNLFHGPIGGLESKFPFPELRIFDLSFNGFTGTLPSNLFKSFSGLMDWEEEKTGIPRESNISPTDYLYRVSLVIKGNEFDMRMITSIMTSIDLSSNRFEGDIPNSIGSLSSLVLLNVPHNNFHGYIPEEIAKLHALEALDLSWNKLIGEIPGKQFNTFSNDSYRGNPDLCGCPLSKECGNNNVSDEPPLDQNDDSIFASRFTWQSVEANKAKEETSKTWLKNEFSNIPEVAGGFDKFISKLVLMFWQIAMDASVSSLNAHAGVIYICYS